MLSRRSLLIGAPAAAMLAQPAWAQQAFPQRPLRMVVPITAGSGTDVVARFFAAELEKQWGTAVVVDNRPGAGGVIGTDFVAKSAPDGHTLLMTYTSHYTNQWIEKTPYDAVADFEPLARLATSTPMMLAGTSTPYRSVRDVIAAARQGAGAVTFGTTGEGSTSHMCGSLLNFSVGISMTHVPYKSATQVLVDAASGQVHVAFAGAVAIPLIKAGKLRVIAVAGGRRTAGLPDVPTMDEAAGTKGYDVTSPIWAMAPRGTPPAVLAKLADAFATIAATPEFKALCVAQNVEHDYQTAAASRAAAPAELEKWRRLVQLTRA